MESKEPLSLLDSKPCLLRWEWNENENRGLSNMNALNDVSITRIVLNERWSSEDKYISGISAKQISLLTHPNSTESRRRGFVRQLVLSFVSEDYRDCQWESDNEQLDD